MPGSISKQRNNHDGVNLMNGKMSGDVIIAKIIGIAVFALGIGLLLLVFRTAHELFTATPAAALGLHLTGNPKTDPTAMAIGQSFGFLLVKILLLFLMALSGSLIAQKGINLFYSAVGHPSRPVSAIAPEVS